MPHPPMSQSHPHARCILPALRAAHAVLQDDVPLEEQVEVLHAWHAWMLQELSHFKSKFGGAGGTLLGAASARGFSAGGPRAGWALGRLAGSASC